jgi:Uma2 family endonuclease
MAASEKRVQEYLTMEQFRAMDESDEWLYELDDGMLVREPRPKRPHGTAVALLGRYLVGYALDHGGIVVTETGIILAEDPPRVFGPDLAYYRQDPAPYGERDGWFTKAPDLVAEVISPSNRAAEMRRKIQKYFESGTREVWVVYPSSRSVERHSPPGEILALSEDEVITSELLPGFELPVSQVFRF